MQTFKQTWQTNTSTNWDTHLWFSTCTSADNTQIIYDLLSPGFLVGTSQR